MDLVGIRGLVEELSVKDRQELLRWLRDSESARKREERARSYGATASAIFDFSAALLAHAGRLAAKVGSALGSGPATGETLRGSIAWSLLSLLIFLVSEGAVFRSGWYFKYVQPESSAGQLTFQVFWLQHELPAKVPEVGVAGDSRIAEGFSARRAGLASGGRLHFWNIGVPGSSPRTWYYLLREGDPDRTRFRTVVLGIDRYEDIDRTEDLRDRPTDLFYVASQLRLTDCAEFADSHPDPEVRRDAWSGCLFKGIPMRRDLLDFLSAPGKRLEAARDWRNRGHGYIDGYDGKPEDLAGLAMDPATHALSFGPGAKAWQRESVAGSVATALRRVPATGAATEYRRQWLNSIVDLYEGTKTKVVLLELPRGPIPPPESKAPATSISELGRRPNVTVLPKEMFHDLEQPDLFADGLHLNHKGRPIFSDRLGLKVSELTGVK